MARRIIDRLRAKIRAGQSVVPFHAANELDDDEISIRDVENIIRTGEVLERQRNPQTRERKYVIEGATLAGETAYCVVKIGPTGQIVIITTWVGQGNQSM